MVSTTRPAWIFSVVNPQTFQCKTAGSCASPEVTDGTGINLCFGFIAKGSRKRPVLFRRFRGEIDFFFLSGFAKMHFFTIKVLKFYRDTCA